MIFVVLVESYYSQSRKFIILTENVLRIFGINYY